MSNKEYTKRQRERVMRQYRSNQGRSPKKEEQIFKVLKIGSLKAALFFVKKNNSYVI
mgnify:CR=1 FL=1